MFPIKKVAICPAPPLLRSTTSLQHKNDALEKELAQVKRMLAAANSTIQDSARNEHTQGDAHFEDTKPLEFTCTVTISGFLKCPHYYQILEVIKTGRISAIKRNTHLANSRVNYSVTVAFFQSAAAKSLLYQHLRHPVKINGERVDITYTSDQDGAEAGYNPESTRVLRLSIPLPPSAGLPPIFGAKLTPGVDVEGRKLLDDELIMFCSPKEAKYLDSLDFSQKLGNGVLDISRLPGEWKGPMELKIEFLSIAACIWARRNMKRDEQWEGTIYKFGADPCGGLVGEAKISMAQGEGMIWGSAEEEDTLRPSDSASWAWEFRNPPKWIEGHISSDAEEGDGSTEFEVSESVAEDEDDFFESHLQRCP